MIRRNCANEVLERAKYFPIIAVTGPRQVGKTTLSRSLFPDKPYASLEDPDTREFATRDPRSFLSQFANGAILDEAQHCPDLFSYLQSIVDERKVMGLFVLTGSQHFGLMSGITQSLAGRVGLIQLLGFTLDELQNANIAPSTPEELLFTGLYPAIYDRKIPPQKWFAPYMASYIERDVRQLINIHDLRTFQLFVRMCAARTGQLLNLSSLASDCGITHNTAKSWISVLEASYIITLLQPHHRNFSKRLIKSPKMYFLDTGLAAWLAGITEPGQLLLHSMRGALFETWVVTELLKARFNRGLDSNLFFWRDVKGLEVDLILEQGNTLTPVEIKSGATVSGDYFAGLKKWYELAGISPNGWVVYGGASNQSRSEAQVIGWQSLRNLPDALFGDTPG